MKYTYAKGSLPIQLWFLLSNMYKNRKRKRFPSTKLYSELWQNDYIQDLPKLLITSIYMSVSI